MKVRARVRVVRRRVPRLHRDVVTLGHDRTRGRLAILHLVRGRGQGEGEGLGLGLGLGLELRLGLGLGRRLGL